MPYSDHKFDALLAKAVRAVFDRDAHLVDVGAGAGKTRDLLPEYPNLYALEVWEPYVTRFKLAERYRAGVICRDLREIGHQEWCNFDGAILGDVLEHLPAIHGEFLVESLSDVPSIYVLPFEYEQGEVYGNPHERHQQDDLCAAVMRERYPELSPLAISGDGGVYVNEPFRSRIPADCGVPELERLRSGERLIHEVAERGSRSVGPADFAHVNLGIATPNPGNVATRYMLSLVETATLLSRMGVEWSLMARTGASIDRSRNQLVKDFMDHPGELTHLLWIDSDQGWDAKLVLRLLMHDRDLVGVASAKKTEDLSFAVNPLQEAAVYERGCVEVEAVGTGFLMLKRSVLVEMFKAYPELQVRSRPGVATDELDTTHYYTLFQTALDEEGRYWGEDLMFCRRWRALGGKVWVDPSADLIHVGTKEYRGAFESVLQVTHKED